MNTSIRIVEAAGLLGKVGLPQRTPGVDALRSRPQVDVEAVNSTAKTLFQILVTCSCLTSCIVGGKGWGGKIEGCTERIP